MERYLINLPAQIVLLSLLTLVFLGAIFLSSRPRWFERYLLLCALSLTGFVVVETYRQYKSPPSNFCHYYLGAKYQIEYLDFYEVILAGSGKPLVDYRDLKGSPAFGIANIFPQQKREYYLRLLDKFNVKHPPQLSTPLLKKLCGQNDLFRKHGQLLLSDAGYSSERQKLLGEDVRSANINVRDCGFNGTPFYVLLRQLDPFLHLPLSINSFRFSVLLELVLLVFSGVLLAKAFRLGTTGFLLFFILVLSSWDFYNWNIPGLPAMAWFFPVAVSLFFLTRERYVGAGLACSVSVLLKIFPGLILLPAMASLAFRKARKAPLFRDGKEIIFLATAATTILALAVVAQTQADWIAWIEKIRGQFASGAFFAPNDICFYKTWHHASIDFPGSQQLAVGVVWATRALLAVFLLYLAGRRPDGKTLALGGIASLAMMPWISNEYLQYYSFPNALILAIFYKERRGFFYLLMPLLLMNQAMVDYPNPIYIRAISSLVWLKTLPYLTVPLFFLFFVVQRSRKSQPLELA